MGHGGWLRILRTAAVGALWVAAPLTHADPLHGRADEPTPAPTPSTAPDQTETVLERPVEKSFFLAPDTKLAALGGGLVNFTGLYGGWLLDRRFLVGAGGWGNTTQGEGPDEGYGGLVLEYFANPRRLWNVSFRLLLGGGSFDPGLGSTREAVRAEARGREARVERQPRNVHDATFFVAEPEAKVFVNVTERVRLGLSLGYRAVVGAEGHGQDLRGPTVGLTLTLFGF